MTKNYTLIEFTLVTKRGRRVVSREPVWMESVKFKDGPGMKVKQMRTTRDITKAMRWSTTTAYDIAVQFSHLPAKLVREDGSVMEPESTNLLNDQLRRHESIRRMKTEMNREFNEIFAPAIKLLKDLEPYR